MRFSAISNMEYAKKRRYTAGEVLDHIFADDDSNDENISDTSSFEDEGPVDESQNPIDDGGDVMDLSIEDPPPLFVDEIVLTSRNDEPMDEVNIVIEETSSVNETQSTGAEIRYELLNKENVPSSGPRTRGGSRTGGGGGGSRRRFARTRGGRRNASKSSLTLADIKARHEEDLEKKWVGKEALPAIPEFKGSPGVDASISENPSALEVFNLFFTAELYDMLVEQSNLYVETVH